MCVPYFRTLYQLIHIRPGGSAGGDRDNLPAHGRLVTWSVDRQALWMRSTKEWHCEYLYYYLFLLHYVGRVSRPSQEVVAAATAGGFIGLIPFVGYLQVLGDRRSVVDQQWCY